MNVAALVPAAGDGRNRQARGRKTPLLLGGRPLWEHTIERLERCTRVQHIYPIVPPTEVKDVKARFLSEGNESKVLEVFSSGLLRQDCIHKALVKLEGLYDFILIHDGARPLVPIEVLERTISAAEIHGAAIASVPVHDTLKAVTRDTFIASSYDRRRLRSIQTPMVFRYDILARAYGAAANESFYASDEAVLVERIGERIKLVAGSQLNIYISNLEDLKLAQAILELNHP